MNSKQILYAVEKGLEQFGTEQEHQIKYLSAIIYLLETDMQTIKLYDGMNLDEHLRYYELKEAVENIKYQITTLKVRKPITKFSKIDDTDFPVQKE